MRKVVRLCMCGKKVILFMLLTDGLEEVDN